MPFCKSCRSGVSNPRRVQFAKLRSYLQANLRQHEVDRHKLRFAGQRTILQILERDRREIGAALQGLAAVRQWVFQHRDEMTFTVPEDNSVATCTRTTDFVSDLVEDFTEEFGRLQLNLIRHTERERLYSGPFVRPFSK